MVSLLGQEIASAVVPRRAVRLWWLAQAGFAFKTAEGKVLYLDPYLSDAVNRLFGFKRLSLSPIDAAEVRADVVILTHEHTDHLDPDALPVVARNNPACVFAASVGCKEGLRQAGVAERQTMLMEPDSRYDLCGVTIHTASADHGEYAAGALTMLLDFGGVRVLVSGDTALRTAAFKRLYDLRPDVLLPCINGTFGNMNHIDAANMAKACGARIVIPCHYFMFAQQAGDPGAFVHACKYIAPEATATLLSPGEGLSVTGRQ